MYFPGLDTSWGTAAYRYRLFFFLGARTFSGPDLWYGLKADSLEVSTLQINILCFPHPYVHNITNRVEIVSDNRRHLLFRVIFLASRPMKASRCGLFILRKQLNVFASPCPLVS